MSSPTSSQPVGSMNVDPSIKVGDSAASRIGEPSVDSPEKKTKVRKIFFYAWAIVGWCVVAGVCIYLLNVLAVPVSIAIWTAVIVFCLRGMVDFLEKHNVKRGLGTTLAYVVMILVLGLIGFMIFSPAFGLNDQFANIFSSIPHYVEEISKWLEEQSTKYSAFLQNDTVKSVMSSAFESLKQGASSMASGAASAAVGVGTGIANTFTAIGFAFVIAFWILMELPSIGAEAKRVMSPKFAEQADFLHVTGTRILGGYIKGTILQCFIIGIVCGILFAICGIPNAPAMGVITGTLNIIPIIGPWLGGVAAAISAIFVSPLKALIALVGTIVIQQIVYTFVSPKIMSNAVAIHPALTLVAMIFGSAIGTAMSGMIGALVGMLLSIPAVAVMKSVFIYYFERSTGRQIVSEDGFLFKGTPNESGVADPFLDATGIKADGSEPHKEEKNLLLRLKSRRDDKK